MYLQVLAIIAILTLLFFLAIKWAKMMRANSTEPPQTIILVPTTPAQVQRWVGKEIKSAFVTLCQEKEIKGVILTFENPSPGVLIAQSIATTGDFESEAQLPEGLDAKLSAAKVMIIYDEKVALHKRLFSAWEHSETAKAMKEFVTTGELPEWYRCDLDFMKTKMSKTQVEQLIRSSCAQHGGRSAGTGARNGTDLMDGFVFQAIAYVFAARPMKPARRSPSYGMLALDEAALRAAAGAPKQVPRLTARKS